LRVSAIEFTNGKRPGKVEVVAAHDEIALVAVLVSGK
jgi:hypothetical protein